MAEFRIRQHAAATSNGTVSATSNGTVSAACATTGAGARFCRHVVCPRDSVRTIMVMQVATNGLRATVCWAAASSWPLPQRGAAWRSEERRVGEEWGARTGAEHAVQ